MYATRQAFDCLEAFREGAYEALCCRVLESGGYMVQTPGYFVAFVVQEEVAHVLFACGDFRGLLAFASAAVGLYGVRRVRWERSLVGKHKGIHEYDIFALTRDYE